jgi:hypothetical protein
MDLQTVVSTLFSNLVMPLLKFGIICIYVAAMIQVVKGVSAFGLVKIFREVLLIIWSNKDKDGNRRLVSEETWRTLSFILALVTLKMMNFTMLAAMIGKDLDTLSPGATWMDYVGTSALVYQGTEWTYKNFALFAEAGKKVKDALIWQEKKP